MYKCKLTLEEYKEFKTLAEKGRGEYVVGMLLERFKLYTSKNYSPDVVRFKPKKLSMPIPSRHFP